MAKNLFIALEGIDGSGKSTQSQLLARQLQQAGHKVYTTFEPTDSPIGKMIRDIFSHRMEADHKVIAGLFVADRLHHLSNQEDGILKKLEEGYTVISDRYYLSSYAYHAAHMSMDWVINANSMAADLLRPDLNIYIDVDPETSMERINKGRSSTEMYETLDNLKNVKAKYFEAFEKVKHDENIYIINGNREEEEVAESIWQEVQKIL
ncbi:dTMP kinase [Porifericola rhodea]|uniref:dTMP kinase n=1 Tax=Porifericola rhodea TaxID=930972 RepID=UPI0026660FE7|nr:dTMP kinase [Porifericola rhodea]WKN30100.1 dTMP kinase [Porifericola rhodea]